MPKWLFRRDRFGLAVDSSTIYVVFAAATWTTCQDLPIYKARRNLDLVAERDYP